MLVDPGWVADTKLGFEDPMLKNISPAAVEMRQQSKAISSGLHRFIGGNSTSLGIV